MGSHGARQRPLRIVGARRSAALKAADATSRRESPAASVHQGTCRKLASACAPAAYDVPMTAPHLARTAAAPPAEQDEASPYMALCARDARARVRRALFASTTRPILLPPVCAVHAKARELPLWPGGSGRKKAGFGPAACGAGRRCHQPSLVLVYTDAGRFAGAARPATAGCPDASQGRALPLAERLGVTTGTCSLFETRAGLIAPCNTCKPPVADGQAAADHCPPVTRDGAGRWHCRRAPLQYAAFARHYWPGPTVPAAQRRRGWRRRHRRTAAWLAAPRWMPRPAGLLCQAAGLPGGMGGPRPMARRLSCTPLDAAHGR